MHYVVNYLYKWANNPSDIITWTERWKYRIRRSVDEEFPRAQIAVDEGKIQRLMVVWVDEEQPEKPLMVSTMWTQDAWNIIQDDEWCSEFRVEAPLVLTTDSMALRQAVRPLTINLRRTEMASLLQQIEVNNRRTEEDVT